MPTIHLTNAKGTHDITGLVTTIRWSGDYRQCSRTLEIGLLSSPTAVSMPVVDCPVGSAVTLTEEGVSLFEGYIISRDKSTASNVIDLTCYDAGFYLNRNETSVKFTGETPEAATAKLCDQFDIPKGSFAATGIAVTRRFSGRKLYDIIMTLYTAAAEVTGKAYLVVFEGGKLHVRAKGAAGEIVVIKSGVNLIDAAIGESMAEMINRVAVYDSDDNLLYTKADDASIAQYGRLQTVVKQGKDEDATAKVETALKNSGPTQTITVNNLGDIRCVTGGVVMVEEAHTGLYGQFYVDSDIHQWKNGIYTNKLVLNLNAIMDEKEAGAEIKGASDGFGEGSSSELQKGIKRTQDKDYIPPTPKRGTTMPEGGER